MQYEFLKQFPRRMKNVGLFAVLTAQGIQKTTWKQYGFALFDEQMNLIMAVLLYIMEQSLKEENCTMDDIGAYIDSLNAQHFGKPVSYEECRNLGDFIVNVVLSNEGRAMYFDGYDFERNAYQIMHIHYVANRVVYLDQEVKRTSYYLTDDGYGLLLSTLEIESNLKLTIHEMIFQLHLEKQSYDKAVDDIKNVFNLLRIQMQKIQEAMGRIRRNALDYSVKDYEAILLENLETISDTGRKFQDYRDMVKKRVKELEEQNINVKRLDPEDVEKLGHLRVIETYLGRAIDEHQRILGGHFDLKSLYTRELEALSQMSFIKRFPLRTALYDKVLKKPSSLEELDYFLRPLFGRDPDKSYNPNQAFRFQRMSRRREADEYGEEALDFDEGAWRAEQERRRREKRLKYEGCLACLLDFAMEKGGGSLKELAERPLSGEERRRLIPNVETFKEIMVELIKSQRIDLEALRREKSEFIQEASHEFQLNEMLLSLTEKNARFEPLKGLAVYRMEDEECAVFDGAQDEAGGRKRIRCSNVWIEALL